MRLDIIEAVDGNDLLIMDSEVAKAGNVASVQIAELEYSPDFGVDKKLFLDSEFQFQNESFKAHIVQRLIEHQVNVSKVIDSIDTLLTTYSYSVGSLETPNGGLVL